MLYGTLSMSVWKRFVQEGILDFSRLNHRISESWYRCQKTGVNPYSGEGRYILTDEMFARQKQENTVLLDIAMPFMERLSKYMDGSKSVVMLIGPEGYVLAMKGDSDTLQMARKINFVEGVKWTEDEVGTNAIGTALQTAEPLTIVGSEHYSIASHGWTCSAAPIFDYEGLLAGILNVSSPVQHYHPHTLGAVVSTTYAMEQQWRIREQNDQLELAQQALNLLQMSQPAVICNSKKQILYASPKVKEAIPQYSLMKLSNLFTYGYQKSDCTPLYSTQHGQMIGYFVRLSTESINMKNKTYTTTIVFPGETGTSEVFHHTLHEIELVARSKTNVHIHGESGTGKEMIAKAIHENSSRKNGPFIAVNCGAIAGNLMESELFGYVEGAFTGARRHGYKGKFEQANHGTLFLDEIGEIPPAMQVALLRVLQEREVTPVGGMKAIPLDIRIITATHRDLRELVQQGNFREDLFFRLFVFPIYVPPLRARKEDIPYFVRFFCRQTDWPVEFSSDMMNLLMKYDWPGNIRELFNVLERIHIISGGGSPDFAQVQQMLTHVLGRSLDMKPSHEPKLERSETEILNIKKPLTYREEIQKQEIIQALRKTGGNASLAARLLDIPRSTFYRRLQKFNL